MLSPPLEDKESRKRDTTEEGIMVRSALMCAKDCLSGICLSSSRFMEHTVFHIYHLEYELCNQTHLACGAPMILEDKDLIFPSFGSSLFAAKVISVFLLGRKWDDVKLVSCLEQSLSSMSLINASYFYVFVSAVLINWQI